MGQLTITLSDELETKVRNYVREQGYDSISDCIRELLSQATSGRPSFWERIYLVNLMEIKQALGEDVSEELIDALKDGYARYYSWGGYQVSKDEMSNEDMKFVEDVLKMYEDLQYSYDKSTEKDTKLEEELSFPGFDGNAGDGYLGYLHFLVKYGKYTLVRPLDKGHAINSHMPVTGMYERMLSKYNSTKRDGFERTPLTLGEIRAIINERVHPDYRK